ncbi:unnamed protein product, partial [Allacma fusca]
RMAYTVPDTSRGFSNLDNETFFWTWNADDGPRPKVILFQLTIIHRVVGRDDIFWIVRLPPVIEFRTEFAWKRPDYADEKKYNCYEMALTIFSFKNFLIAPYTIHNHRFLKKSLAGSGTSTDNYEEPLDRVSDIDRLFPKTRHESIKFRGLPQLEKLNLSSKEYLPETRQVDGLPDEKRLYHQCFSGKRCLEDVPGCADSHRCRLLATYSRNHDYIRDYFRFELMANIPSGYGYVAVALSSDSNMGDDSVIECVVDSRGYTGIYMSFNSGYQNYRLSKASCTEISSGPLMGCNVTVVDGKLLCNFYRRNFIQVGGQIFDMLTVPYYIHRASGHKVTDFRGTPRRKSRVKRDITSSITSTVSADPDTDVAIGVDGNIGHHDIVLTTSKPMLLSDVDEVTLLVISYYTWKDELFRQTIDLLQFAPCHNRSKTRSFKLPCECELS